MNNQLALSAVLAALLLAVSPALAADPWEAPLENIYWGDLHVHTNYSLDAFMMFQSQGRYVDEAGRYAIHCGKLDFYSVTDHAETLTRGDYWPESIEAALKPVEEERLVTAVNRALAFQEIKQENIALRQHILDDTLEQPDAFKQIITSNKKMLLIFQYIESIARTSQPALIRGETGVGKELIARTLHELSGLRGSFVAVNAAGLDDNVFSDTLFGHVRGAFTGADKNRSGLIEQAAGGTLFLDEIGDLSHASQVKLLRLLQEGEYFPLGSDTPRMSDARLVAATNQNLSSLQEEGRFRNDLNYRLRTHRIYIPPLRRRLDDIPLLVDHFLARAARQLKKDKPTVPKELFDLLKTYAYPGNIRELQSMIFDAISQHKSGVLSMEAFKTHLGRSGSIVSAATAEKNPASPAITFSDQLPTIKEATRLLVEEALKRSGGNQSIAAGMLGISQQALSKRLKKMS